MAKQRPRTNIKRRHQRQRRSSTPSTPVEQVRQAAEAKRLHNKKRKAKERQQRRGSMISAAAQRARRERWAAMAMETQQIVFGDGQYVEERPVSFVPSVVTQPSNRQGPSFVTRVLHNIAAPIVLSRQRTVFYPHYSPILAKWQDAHPPSSSNSAQIVFTRQSTLNAARGLVLAHSQDPLTSTDVGVLSFASAKRAGGGYLHGSSEQEDTIARHSSLVVSLSALAAQDFYKEHRAFRAEDGSGLHDHSIVYSPGVVVFRQDADDDAPSGGDALGGGFIPPYTIDVLSAVPVNAAAVRKNHLILPDEQKMFEDGIRHAMKERMARSLRAFETQGDKVLVLGAFGCGSFENKVDMIADIWAELLVCGDTVRNVKQEARFKKSFEKVVFAVPGRLHEPFMKAFDMRILQEELTTATML